MTVMDPDRRGPCAVKVARTVPTGGMEKRVLRYRALSLPTRQAVKMPGLAERWHGNSKGRGFQPTGKLAPGSIPCPMGQ
jgi:hypothetical protein